MVKPITSGRFIIMRGRVVSTRTRSEFMIVLRLKVALPAAVTSFYGSLTSLALTSFRRFSQVFPKTVRQQFVQRGLEFGFGILTLLVAVFDQRPHEWALSERHDPVRAHEPHSVCQIEFQTAVVSDLKRLVADVRYQLVARDVFAADELVHFFQCGLIMLASTVRCPG